MTKDEFFQELEALVDKYVKTEEPDDKEEELVLKKGDILRFPDENVVYLGDAEQEGLIIGASLTERAMYYKKDAELYGARVEPDIWEVYGSDVEREQDDE